MSRRVPWIVSALVCLSVAVAAPVRADAGTPATVVAEPWTLPVGQKQVGDVVVFGASATIQADARLVGNLVVLGGDTQVDGQVTGDIAVFGGTVSLGATAEVGGDLIVLGELCDNTRRRWCAAVWSAI